MNLGGPDSAHKSLCKLLTKCVMDVYPSEIIAFLFDIYVCMLRSLVYQYI